jgi:YfiR/HmsC-like
MVFRRKTIYLVAAWLITIATAQTVDEYRVKGAFIFNFAKFIQWPPQAFKTPTDPLVICVLGKDRIASVLRELVSANSINGRSAAVRLIADGQPACGCHILFVGFSENKRFRASLGDAGGILLVGETPGFAVNGGLINFKVEGGKVRFEINAAAAEREQFHVSAKLLSLAHIVTGEAQ